MLEMECDGNFVVGPPKVWDEKGKEIKSGTKRYEEIVDGNKPGEIYNDPKRYKSNRTEQDGPWLIEPTVDRQLDSKPDEVFTFAEEMPQFPGGEAAMTKFLNANIIFPEAYKKAGKSGSVYIEYIVEKDGSVTNVRVQKGVAGLPDFAMEAMRVVALFPNHSSAKMNGHAIRCKVTVPVRFVLQ